MARTPSVDSFLEPRMMTVDFDFLQLSNFLLQLNTCTFKINLSFSSLENLYEHIIHQKIKFLNTYMT